MTESQWMIAFLIVATIEMTVLFVVGMIASVIIIKTQKRKED